MGLTVEQVERGGGEHADLDGDDHGDEGHPVVAGVIMLIVHQGHVVVVLVEEVEPHHEVRPHVDGLVVE